MSNKDFDALVSFEEVVHDGITYTLQEFINFPVAIGTPLTIGDSSGNIAKGSVVSIEHQIVGIKVDTDSIQGPDA